MAALFETEKSIISKLEGGIIRVEIKANVELNIHDLNENFELYLNMMDEDKADFLVVFGANAMALKEARDEFAKKERGNIKRKEALVLQSLAHRILAQFHITFNRPKHPTRIFNNENEALDWLRSK